jgi:hypothetical protein
LIQNANLRKESKQGRKKPVNSGKKCTESYKFEVVFWVRKMKKRKRICA